MADFSCALVENVCGYVLIACVKTVATFSPFGRVLPAAVLPRLACSAGDPLRSRHPPRRELWYHYFMAYIRKFKTTSGATGVQVCYKEGNRVIKTVHVGSASSDKALARLLREAQGIIDQEKGEALFNLKRYDRK